MIVRQKFADVNDLIAAQNSNKYLSDNLRTMIVDYVNNGGDPDSSQHDRIIEIMNAAINHRNVTVMQHILGYPELSLEDKKNAINTCKNSAIDNDDKSLNAIQRMIAVDIAQNASSIAEEKNRKAKSTSNLITRFSIPKAKSNPQVSDDDKLKFKLRANIEEVKSYISSNDTAAKRVGVNFFCTTIKNPNYARFLEEYKNDIDDLNNASSKIMNDLKSDLSIKITEMINQGNYDNAHKLLQLSIENNKKALGVFSDIKASLYDLGNQINNAMTSKFLDAEMQANGKSNPEAAVKNIINFQSDNAELLFEYKSSIVMDKLKDARTELMKAKTIEIPAKSNNNDNNAPDPAPAPTRATDPKKKFEEAKKNEAAQYKRMSSSEILKKSGGNKIDPSLKRTNSTGVASKSTDTKEDKQTQGDSNTPRFGKK